MIFATHKKYLRAFYYSGELFAFMADKRMILSDVWSVLSTPPTWDKDPCWVRALASDWEGVGGGWMIVIRNGDEQGVNIFTLTSFMGIDWTASRPKISTENSNIFSLERFYFILSPRQHCGMVWGTLSYREEKSSNPTSTTSIFAMGTAFIG